MSGLDIFAWIIFIVSIISMTGVFLALGQMPGKTARERGHPQSDAIDLAGWLGLILTMGVVWVFAMIWARTVPADSASDELSELRKRISELENQQASSSIDSPTNLPTSS